VRENTSSNSGGRSAVIYDRDATMAAVDHDTMVGLADELLGAHRGSPRSPSWPCPNPDHVQSGRTPPVTVFTDRFGEQRWKCHSCGVGGTAVDLLVEARGMTVREALGDLAHRTGTPPLAPGQRPHRRPKEPRPPLARPEPINPFHSRVVPALDRYVNDCATALWRPEGAAVRRWLTRTRALPEQTLRANKIGVDLGPSLQQRPDGVPQVRRAVVLPVLVEGGACYVQLRALNSSPGFPKYVNTRDELAPNPRLAAFHPSPPDDRHPHWPELLVTEGIIDALTAASAGYRAIAFLGAGYPDRRTAVFISRLQGPIVVAFDPDPAGQAGAHNLVRYLAAQRREAAVLRLPAGSDLNACAVKSHDWPIELAARVEHATYPLTRLPPALVHG